MKPSDPPAGGGRDLWRVLQVHNEYRSPGGESAAVTAEHDMLVRSGHHVVSWRPANAGLDRLGPRQRVAVAAGALWSRRAAAHLRTLIADVAPDVVHVHNTVPVVSPSVFGAAWRTGVPVVRTLHNYRSVCPAGSLYRDGKPCQDCVPAVVALPGIRHACYHGSRGQTAVVAASNTLDRALGVSARYVDAVIAPSSEARRILLAGGWPAEQVHVKPNVVHDLDRVGRHAGGFALYVGRLVDYKGIDTIVSAWRLLAGKVPLKVAGAGPSAETLRAAAPPGVELLGELPADGVRALMRDAAFLVHPSIWPEPFGLVVAEAFASGMPVVASRAGGPADMVTDGETGWLHEPGDAAGLADAVTSAWASADERRRRGRLARAHYLTRYTPARNLDQLLAVYAAAARHRHRASAHPPTTGGSRDAHRR